MGEEMKYYGNGGEVVYKKDHWLDQVWDTGKPVVVELQKREKGGECLWCSELGEFIYTRDECGKQCKDYAPRNGKSGCCKKAAPGFVGTGEFYEINEIGLVTRVEHPTGAISGKRRHQMAKTLQEGHNNYHG